LACVRQRSTPFPILVLATKPKHSARRPANGHHLLGRSGIHPQSLDHPKTTRSNQRAREPRVNWFLKSTRPQAVEGRRVVNDFYSRFPDTNGMLRRRLRSRNNLDLRTALDELFVHEQLSRRYRADFKLYDGPDYAATVEVVSLMDGPKWEHQRRRHGRIEDCGPYHPRYTRFDNPLAAKAFPADALPFDGHWGATQRDATHVSADWLVRPVPPMPVRRA
jgi:hypothetical protein